MFIACVIIALLWYSNCPIGLKVFLSLGVAIDGVLFMIKVAR